MVEKSDIVAGASATLFVVALILSGGTPTENISDIECACRCANGVWDVKKGCETTTTTTLNFELTLTDLVWACNKYEDTDLGTTKEYLEVCGGLKEFGGEQ